MLTIDENSLPTNENTSTIDEKILSISERRLTLGEKVKMYETKFTGQKIDPSLPFVIRLDGHCFSRFTQGLKKPYDYNLYQAFVNTTMYLMKEFQATTAYTHSDEISLLFYPQKTRNDVGWREPLFGGRIQKMITIVCGMCTMFFNKELFNIFSDKKEDYADKEPTFNRMINSQSYFDARIFQLPNDVEMFSYIYWRSQVDCKKNHVYGLARKHFTKGELHKKSTNERVAMLAEKDIIWDNEPACFRRGSFFKKVARDTENNLIRFDFKEIDIDLTKFNNEINNLLKCEVYEPKPIIIKPVYEFKDDKNIIFGETI
jgi:tRNA(His) 5'-end guanylyltransferase